MQAQQATESSGMIIYKDNAIKAIGATVVVQAHPSKTPPVVSGATVLPLSLPLTPEDKAALVTLQGSVYVWSNSTGFVATVQGCLNKALCKAHTPKEGMPTGFLEATAEAGGEVLVPFLWNAPQSYAEDAVPVAKSKFSAKGAIQFMNQPAPAWLVKGMLLDGGLTFIYGPSASGKTFFALSLAGAVSTGSPWQGRKVKQGKVLYICAEGTKGFQDRILAYHLHVKELSNDTFHVLEACPKFNSPEDTEAVRAMIADSGITYRLIVVDTLSQVSAGSDENSVKDMGEVMANIMALKSPDTSVLVIAHTGKSATTEVRGASIFKPMADAMIMLKKDLDESTARTAHVVKVKDGEDGYTFKFSLNRVTVHEGNPEVEDDEKRTSCVVEYPDAGAPVLTAKEELLRFVSTVPHKPQSYYVTAALKKQYVSKFMTEFVEKGWVVKAGKGHGTYSTTKEGEKALLTALGTPHKQVATQVVTDAVNNALANDL